MPKVESSWHEAGHSVVAEVLGARVELVEVGEFGGGSCHAHLGRVSREAQAAVLLAGVIASGMAHLPGDLASSADLVDLRALNLTADQIRKAGELAGEILLANWPAVRSIARKLARGE
jgi:hypothetical protein